MSLSVAGPQRDRVKFSVVGVGHAADQVLVVSFGAKQHLSDEKGLREGVVSKVPR